MRCTMARRLTTRSTSQALPLSSADSMQATQRMQPKSLTGSLLTSGQEICRPHPR